MRLNEVGGNMGGARKAIFNDGKAGIAEDCIMSIEAGNDNAYACLKFTQANGTYLLHYINKAEKMASEGQRNILLGRLFNELMAAYGIDSSKIAGDTWDELAANAIDALANADLETPVRIFVNYGQNAGAKSYPSDFLKMRSMNFIQSMAVDNTLTVDSVRDIMERPKKDTETGANLVPKTEDIATGSMTIPAGVVDDEMPF